ncbi:MAG: hypothetical protein LBF24_00490 [Puniceicoccales bacterium]|jgi:hypothetical protein|nr:hypothetical protein [Puniceicoccales bacterium]
MSKITYASALATLEDAGKLLQKGEVSSAALLVFRKPAVAELIETEKPTDAYRFLAFIAKKSTFASPNGWDELKQKMEIVVRTYDDRGDAELAQPLEEKNRFALKNIRAIDGIAHNLQVRKFHKDGTAYLEADVVLQHFLAQVLASATGELKTFAACALLSVKAAGLLQRKIANDISSGVSLAVTSNAILKKMGVAPWAHLTYGDEGHSGFIFGKNKEERDLWDTGFVGKLKPSAKELCQVKLYRIDLAALQADDGVAGELRKMMAPDFDRLVADKFQEVLDQVTLRTYGYRVNTVSVIVLFFVHVFNAICTFLGKNVRRTGDIANYYDVDQATGEIRYSGPADEGAFRTHLCYCSGYLLATILGTMQIVDNWLKWHIRNTQSALSEEQRRSMDDPNFSFFRPLVAPGVHVPAVMTHQFLHCFSAYGAITLAPRKNLRGVVCDFPDNA